MTSLGAALMACGPVVDPQQAARTREVVEAALGEGSLAPFWPALAPVFGASPYLGGLARRRPAFLMQTLMQDPADRLACLIAGAKAQGQERDVSLASQRLRQGKADLHLLCALADLSAVWDLDQVTGALSAFADAALEAALAQAAAAEIERGRLLAPASSSRGPVPGLFCLAMGKHGALELNYSSDIDISVFYDPELIPLAVGAGAEAVAVRIAQSVARILQDRTPDGYVFRVDLRLRPDPASTPIAVSVPAAFSYYESVGQNWERAAFIKARPVIGDLAAGAGFVNALRPFIWRRSLDYPAILDIQSIKRQIHVHKTGEGMEAAGANLKLGRGGIREIEFFAQTQQLILGGRDPALRSPRTVDALVALRDAGHVSLEVCADLTAAYAALRGLEHRVQMLDDEQTHILPAEPVRRAAVAALAGEGDLAAFDHRIEALLVGVNRTYGQLFEDEEALSSPYGSLVFTGIENDPETLATLERMGFTEPGTIADTIRSWHHGRIPATRSARGRELFTRLAPRLLTALADTGAADAAFRRFAVFFAGLNSGVQVQALFLAQPKLFDLVVGVMAFAPRLARTLGRYPAALDSMLDARFHTQLGVNTGLFDQMTDEAAAAPDFEGAMNAVRRLHRDQMFRIGVQILTGRIGPEQAGRAHTALADAVIAALAPAALAEAARQGGALPDGVVAVVALGKAGSCEMTAGSDLDLMTVYDAPPEAVSDGKGWAAGVFYSRFTQRLIAALSAYTAEGGLYEVDMRLRPGAAKGPVSLRLPAVEDYYASEADTWEFMALTRARVVWTNDPAFGARTTAALEAILRRPRPGVDVAADARRMRDLMARERPGQGAWDLKLAPGGQVDAEFVAQVHQLKAAAGGGRLTVSTLEALEVEPVLAEAWRLQQALAQVFSAAFDDRPDPEQEPEGFQRRLAEAADFADFDTLKARLAEVRTAARAALETVLPPPRDGD